MLAGKSALVTGSTSNIGLAIARVLAREGARVIVHSRHPEQARAVAGELDGDWVTAELAEPEAIRQLFATVAQRQSRLDVLVNCAAVSDPAGLLDVALEDWQRVLAVNLTAPMLCMQAAALLMPSGGAIVNISAGSAARASPGRAAYAVSKAGVEALTRQAAVELAPQGIRVNAVASGRAGTPIGQPTTDRRGWDDPQAPLRRVGDPQEVAEAVAFLASARASFITGAVLPVDGGRLSAR